MYNFKIEILKIMELLRDKILKGRATFMDTEQEKLLKTGFKYPMPPCNPKKGIDIYIIDYRRLFDIIFPEWRKCEEVSLSEQIIDKSNLFLSTLECKYKGQSIKLSIVGNRLDPNDIIEINEENGKFGLIKKRGEK